MKAIVIETLRMTSRRGYDGYSDHETLVESTSEWGVSFNGYNPEDKDYVPVQNKEVAFTLANRINLLIEDLTF